MERALTGRIRKADRYKTCQLFSFLWIPGLLKLVLHGWAVLVIAVPTGCEVSGSISPTGIGHQSIKMPDQAAVPVAVTGPVDYANAIWTSSPRIESAHGITIRDLIRHTNMELAKRLGDFFPIDNNAKAAIVSEYQHLEDTAGSA